MRHARVLVLEHHRDLRDALVDALLDEGYVVTPAPTLSATLLAMRTAADGQIPDAIVLDAQDGRDLVTEVHAERRYANIALVTLSFAFDPPSEADRDVRRPFRLEELLSAVREALERHAFPAQDLPPAHP